MNNLLLAFQQIYEEVLSKPFGIQILALLMFVALFLAIINFLILPFIFRFTVIKPIERRYGEKLKYLPTWNIFLFGNFIMGTYEVAACIVIKYLAYKWNIKTKKICLSPLLALVKLNYVVTTATRREIRLSFFTMISFILQLILLLSAFVLTAYLKSSK